MAQNNDFRKALRARYVRAILGGYGGALLAFALLTNLTLHHWLFNKISDAVGLYRSMTLVILALSVDFFALCLVAACHSAYVRFKEGGLYRDLQLAAVSPWEAVRPILWIAFLLGLADAMIELTVAALMTNDLGVVKLLGAASSFVYALPSTFFLANLILFFCLVGFPRTLQLFAVIAISFVSLISISTASDAWGRSVAEWPASGGIGASIAGLFGGGDNGGTWRSIAPFFAYYVCLLVAGAVLGMIGLGLHVWSRRNAHRANKEKARSDSQSHLA